MARAENKVEAGGAAHVVAALAKALREQQGLTQTELGKTIGYTGSAISAMETCAQPASDDMLVKLEETVGAGLGVFDKARKWMLLEKYPVRFRGFAEIEAGAITISSYETLVVDGLFQTEAYARALIGGSYPPVSEQKREELVEAPGSRGRHRLRCGLVRLPPHPLPRKSVTLSGKLTHFSETPPLPRAKLLT